jgi:outer membrane protein
MTRKVLAVAVVAVALSLTSPLAAQQFENVPQAQPAAPQQTAASGLRVGVINFQFAMASTQEGRKALEDLQARFSPRQSELQKLADEIRDLENQLRAQERTLSQDAQAQLVRQAELKRKAYTRAQQDLQDDAEAARNDYIATISQKMEQVVSRFAQEKQLNLILNYGDGSNTVIFATPTVDITQDVIKLYDQTHPVQAGTAPGTGAPAARGQSPAPQRKPNQ